MSSGRKGRLHVHPCRREAQRRAAWSLAWAVGLSVALVGAASSQEGGAVAAGGAVEEGSARLRAQGSDPRSGAQRNFSVERGTVALWVQPLNWRGDDDLHHLFFQAWPEGGGDSALTA